MAVIGPSRSDRMEPTEEAGRNTCRDCVFCRGGAELMCFWDIVSAVLDQHDMDDADVRLVDPGDEGCRHWRRSKWA